MLFRSRLPRRPGEWLPVFTQWAALSADFGDLQEALTVSDTFRLGRVSDPEQLVGDRYDAVDPQDESRALAKLSLLNLYARLREEPLPGSDTTWFSTVEKLIVATRERFMAIVTEDCFDAVQQLSKKGKSGYHHSNPGPHKKNFTDLAGASDVKKHASVKTDVKKANLQFTVAEGRLGEARVFLLDADIDENGSLLLHTFDLIKHFFNGGTHPLDIHEALREQFRDLDLGYGVEPKRRIELAAPRETSVAMTAVPAPFAATVDTAAMAAPAAIVGLGDSVP